MLSYGTQMTQIYTEEHRFLFFFNAGTAQPKKYLCQSVSVCVICVLSETSTKLKNYGI